MDTNTPNMTAPEASGFAAFGLPRALMASLDHMKYSTPTPVQQQAIPAAMKGKDVLGSAQTGTGKTGAFIIPVLARLLTDPHASALIMTPTRELAAQILTVARQMLHKNEVIKMALLIGGESIGRQRAQLSARPRLVIGTPGRINDHLRDRTTLFANTNMLVLDEADRMLDMGFTPQINNVIKHMTAPKRQTLLFSATFADNVMKLTQNYMHDPVRVTIEPERTSAANIIHESIETTEKTRYDDLLNELYNRKGSIILFIKTKHGADRMKKKLVDDGHSADVIHGDLSQRQRDRAIAAFRNKSTRVMVATDVAARGLDVPHIEHVINYDLPQVAEDYVHRIGRTGRNGAEGRALAFLMPSERGKWNAIQRILNPDFKPARSGGKDGAKGGGRKQGGHRGSRNMGHSDREFEQRAPRPQQQQRPAPRFDPMEGQEVMQAEAPAQERKPQWQKRERTPFGDAPRSQRTPFGDKPRRERNASERPQNDNAFGDKPRGERAFGDKPRNDKPRGDRPFGDKPRGDRPFGDKPRGERPQGERAWQGKPRRDDNRGNTRKPERQDGERNFNTEGAGGEDRFRTDFPGYAAKPAGKSFQKKKFFGKNKGFGKQSRG